MKKPAPRREFSRPFTLQSDFCFAKAVPAARDGAAWSLIWSAILLFTSVCAFGRIKPPRLPQSWVNDHECGSSFAVTLRLKAIGGDYPTTQAGLNSALAQWAGDTVSYHIVIEARSLLTGYTTITIPSGRNTACAVVESSTPLASGRTVCAHGFTDASGPDPGARNPGCTNDIDSMYTIEQTDRNYIMNFQSGSNHIVFRDAELRFGPTSAGAPASPAVSVGHDDGTTRCRNDPTCDQRRVAQAPAHIGFDRVYFHGYDPSETATFIRIAAIKQRKHTVTVTTTRPNNLSNRNAVVIRGVSPPNFNGTFGPIARVNSTTFTYTVADSGKGSGKGGATAYASGVDVQAFMGMQCRYCWIVNSYAEKIHDTGVESHPISGTNGPGPILIAHNWIEGGSENLLWGGNAPQIPNNVPSDIEIRRNRFTRNIYWRRLTGALCTVDPVTGKCPQDWAMKNALELKVCRRCLLDGNIYENIWSDGQTGGLRLMDVEGGGQDIGLNPNAIIADITETNEVWRHAAQGLLAGARSGAGGNGGGPSLPEQRVLIENILLYDISNAGNYGKGDPVATLIGSGGNNFTCSAQRDSQGVTSTYRCTRSDGNPFSQMDVNVGDPVYVQKCTDRSFQTARNVLGPPALAATDTTVTIFNLGPPDGSSSRCIVNNGQGWQQYFRWDHNTSAFGDSLRILSPQTYSFARSVVHTGNIGASLYKRPGGIICSGISPGTAAEGCMDITTLELNNEVFEGLTPSQYTDYPSGNNGDCVAPNQPPGCTAASTLYFPAHIACATSNPSSEINHDGRQTCIGWAGFVNGNVYPPSDWFALNYHDLALCKSAGNSDYGPDTRCGGPSLYSGGQSQQAISGTQQNPSWRSMGPSLLDIDSAFGLTKYVCHSFCGSAGPYRE